MNERIKIFISSQKPVDIITNDILTPIQTGVALGKHEKLPNFLYDDVGDNISQLNPSFCELTAQYWAWKNVDADYYGFFHYSRYLSFSNSEKNEPKFFTEPYIYSETIEKLGLDEESIKNAVQDYDILLPPIFHFYKDPNIYEWYSNMFAHYKEDLDILIDVIRDKYPSFEPYMNEILFGNKSYMKNIFIMKKDIFNDYCKWLFDILLECDKRIDYSERFYQSTRAIGFMAENLVSIYVSYAIKERNCRIKELSLVTFDDIEFVPVLKPAFNEKTVIPIFSAIDEKNAPIIATCIQSIVENSSPNNNYDIVLIHYNLSQNDKRKLLSIVKNCKNISLRFFNAYRDNHIFNKNIKPNLYYSFLVQDIIKDYNKAIWLDNNTIVKSDVAELYSVNIDDYLLAAAHDQITFGTIHNGDNESKDYFTKTLEMKNSNNYFSGSVMLMNLEKMRAECTIDDWFQLISKSYLFGAQDILNKYCEGRVKYLDMTWNYMSDNNSKNYENLFQLSPKYLYDEYLQAKLNPMIIRFGNRAKPWKRYGVEYEEEFWALSRKTPYYEMLLKDFLSNVDKENYKQQSYLKLKEMFNKLFPRTGRINCAAREIRKKISKTIYIKKRHII